MIEAADAARPRADAQIGAEGERQKAARQLGARRTRVLRRRAGKRAGRRRLPAGGGERRASPATIEQNERIRARAHRIDRHYTSSAPLAHQAFLRHRGDQRAVAREYQSAREAARAVQVGRILRVEQPVVGAERPVQPQRMIEARGHEFLLEQRAAVRHQRGVEQRHVGGIGQHALMDRRIVRQLAGGADPDVEAAVGIFLAEIAVELDRPQFDRPLALVIAPHRIGHGRQHLLAHLGFARQFFRRRHVRHLGLVIEALPRRRETTPASRRSDGRAGAR